jgi:predicted  nucleic acid-binding Zn-ribbon protein
VLKETESLRAGCDDCGVKRKKSKTQQDRDALAAVTKEMAQPRFAESARRDEEAAIRPAPKTKKRAA